MIERSIYNPRMEVDEIKEVREALADFYRARIKHDNRPYTETLYLDDKGEVDWAKTGNGWGCGLEMFWDNAWIIEKPDKAYRIIADLQQEHPDLVVIFERDPANNSLHLHVSNKEHLRLIYRTRSKDADTQG